MTEAESSSANLEQFLSGAGANGKDTETALLGRMVSADVERALAAVPPTSGWRCARRPGRLLLQGDRRDHGLPGGHRDEPPVSRPQDPAGAALRLRRRAGDHSARPAQPGAQRVSGDPSPLSISMPIGASAPSRATANELRRSHRDLAGVRRRRARGVDRESVERHLVTCPTCAGRVRLQTRFRAAVRAHLHRPEVPFTLRRRVEETLASQPIAPRRWPVWLSMSRVVPAAAALFLIVAITATVRRSNSMALQQCGTRLHQIPGCRWTSPGRTAVRSRRGSAAVSSSPCTRPRWAAAPPARGAGL